MDSPFWKGKRVFVTGHSGFKGTWLCMLLRQCGAELTGYSLGVPSSPCLSDLIGLRNLMTSIEADIRDYTALKTALQRSQPEIIIHMAAQSLVRRSYQDPIGTYSTNVMGTVNLLEAVRDMEGIRVIVNVTSDKCYENREMVWGYRENEPLGGYDPYSNSKACAELVTSAFRNSFFHSPKNSTAPLSLASVRAGNVIGGGDWGEDRLVPDIVRAFSRKETVRIRHPKAVRPWQHVLDPIVGYLTLAEKAWSSGIEYADAWNFGPSEESAKSVEWLVQQIADRWGDGARWEIDTAEHHHETSYLKLDSSKSRSRLGWSTLMNVEDALDRTISWYKRLDSGEDARAITLDQLYDIVGLTSEKVRTVD